MRLNYPATARNRDPILAVLGEVLPAGATVLEIASGSGEHALYFSQRLKVRWQPSDIEDEAVASIRAWREEGPPTLLEPLQLDVRSGPWPERADAVVCINMIHISPWSCTEALLRGAARILPDDGVLYLYGPYKIDGAHTAPSNEAFDRSLRMRNPEWGVRDLDAVVDLAAGLGLQHEQTVSMPANNQSVVFRKA